MTSQQVWEYNTNMSQLQRKSEVRLDDMPDSQRHSLDKAAYTALVSSFILGAIFTLWMFTWLVFDVTWEGSRNGAITFQVCSVAVAIVAWGATDAICRRRRDDAPRMLPLSIRFPVGTLGVSGLICAYIIGRALAADEIFINRAIPVAFGILVVTGYICIWIEFFLRRRNAKRDSAESWNPEA